MRWLSRQRRCSFGHHYEHYDFLVAASSHLRPEGTEHTQSSDDIVPSADTSNPNAVGGLAAKLSHEFVHSWCGKYRRPAGIATGDYSTPMQDDLIWVYEGLTQYYGEVLKTRAGFQTPADTISSWDYSVFTLDQPGRRWRSLQGSADAASILRDSDPAWGELAARAGLLPRRRAAVAGCRYEDQGVDLWRKVSG